MVEFTNDSSFGEDKITSKLFLSSIKEWHNEGVPIGVEKVGKPYKSQNPKRIGIVVKITILDMEKCLGRVIEGGEVKTKYNPSIDANEPVTEVIDASNEQVTFYFNAKNVENASEFNEDTVLAFSPLSTAYPLLKCALETNGVTVPANKWIRITPGEMKYYLEGFECTAKYGNSGQMKGIKPYSFMVCENGVVEEVLG